MYLIALVLFAAITALGLANASAGPPPPELIASETFPGWGYQVWAEPDGYMSARIDYKRDSVQALRNYVTVNKTLANQLRSEGLSEFVVIVTFKRPIALDDFWAWVAVNPLKVNSYTLRVLAKDGSRVTIGGAPSEESPREAEAHLRRILGIVARHGATDVQGIMSVEGVLSATDYDKLVADKNIFLVDVTRSAVLQRLMKIAPQVRLKVQAIMVPLAFPDMEDLGLDNFQ